MQDKEETVTKIVVGYRQNELPNGTTRYVGLLIIGNSNQEALRIAYLRAPDGNGMGMYYPVIITRQDTGKTIWKRGTFINE